MRIANQYNHLNAREFLIVNRPEEFNELKNTLMSVDANKFLKISCEMDKLGQVFYSQSRINKEIKRILQNLDWDERKIYYFVTGDEATSRDIINIHDKEEQKRIIEERGFQSYSTFNQVDFQKERIAVEVQFGKYFSVAYDLHVKHTFFYSRNDIDVGIEVIPTKAMEEHMDSGVPWFENEVTNVIREGRTNPPVPILILGVEPDSICSVEPTDYADERLIEILRNSNRSKLRDQIAKKRREQRISPVIQDRIDKIEACIRMMGNI